MTCLMSTLKIKYNILLLFNLLDISTQRIHTSKKKNMISSYKNSSKPYLSGSLNIRPVVKRRPEEAFMPALAGLVGGSLSTLLLHPLDVLKTRQGVYGGSMMYHLNKLVWTTRGGLYRGVGANLLVSSTSWGLYFSS